MSLMDDLELEKDMLELALYRKNELKSILRPLIRQYDAVKKEIEARKKRAERLIQENQDRKLARTYGEFLETVKIEDYDLDFPKE
jgi:molecular chaperone GrpE (heat shock protein)